MTPSESESDLPKASGHQKLLFPQSARDVCEEIGLNWWAAIKLFEEGWLSFDPRAAAELNDAHDAELRFVGSLITAGSSPELLRHLLSGLSKPYHYQNSEIYYDWRENRWRPLPEPANDPEAVLGEWIHTLVENQNVPRLTQLKEQIELALRQAHP